MLATIHDPGLGGMVATDGLPAWKVNKLLNKINTHLGQDGLMQLVKHNSPTIKVVAGPREGLNMMGQLVAGKAKFFDNISPYRFHHSTAMADAASLYQLYLAQEGAMGKPSELLEHVSGVTGEVLKTCQLAEDLANGVANPVFFHTFRGSSIHGAAHRNEFYDAIVFNRKIETWLKPSKWVATHLVNNYDMLGQVKSWLMQVINGEVQPGKVREKRQAAPSLRPAY